MRFSQVLFSTLSLLFFTHISFAEEAIGKIVSLQGTVTMYDMEGTETQLELNSVVYEGAEIETATGAKVKIVFNDDSQITLAEETTLTLDEYIYSADEDTDTSLFSISKGLLKFVTGKIAKQNPSNYEISSGVASIGVRGSAGFIKVDDEGATTLCAIECCLSLSSLEDGTSLNLDAKYDFAHVDDAGVLSDKKVIDKKKYTVWEKAVLIENK